MAYQRLFAAAGIAALLLCGKAFAEPAKRAERAPSGLLASISLADIGFSSGFRFSNLGGRREIFVPLPQGQDLTASEFRLVLDDVSAHEARRNLEILIDDRSVAALALDGKSPGRVVRLPLAKAKARDGFLKLTFLYSGAATPDRCIDVRSVGDSLTVRPESTIEIEVGAVTPLDVATIAALLPRDVAIILHNRRLSSTDIAAALTVARAMKSSGRRVTFHRGLQSLPDIARRDDSRRFSRGLVVIGTLDDVSGFLDAPVTTIAGPLPAFGSIGAIRLAGLPALLVTDSGAVRASRLFASPALAATRGNETVSVGDVAEPKSAVERITFDALGLAPSQADVFGRAELTFAFAARALPEGTRPARIVLDVMVAPDGAGEKAVVSAFVNERLLGSQVASNDAPTRLDLALPAGLVGSIANIRIVVQRRSAQGDCRFDPQGYPAQLLGSSALILERAGPEASDFSDLAAFWTGGVEILLSQSTLERSVAGLSALADILASLSADSAPITVRFVEDGAAPAPAAPFIAIGPLSPGGKPRVHFDHGRVAVADRAGRNLLDLGGLGGGAVVQLVNTDKHPGLWIKPLANDGALPSTAELRLDRGDVAFVDQSGVALALSTARDTLVHINYPDQVSWLTIAERFRTWIVGGLWLTATVLLLFALQRMFRRLRAGAGE